MDAPVLETLSQDIRRALADIVYRGGIELLPCGWSGTWTHRDSVVTTLIERRLCHKQFCLLERKWVVNATPVGRDTVFSVYPDAAALCAALADKTV